MRFKIQENGGILLRIAINTGITKIDIISLLKKTPIGLAQQWQVLHSPFAMIILLYIQDDTWYTKTTN